MGVVLVAIGSPGRADGAAAWRVAAELANEAEGIEIVTVRELSSDLATRLAEASGVIFVVPCEVGEPGTVAIDLLAPGRAGAGGELTPEALLGLAGRPAGAAFPAALVSLSGARFEAGEELSEAVEEAIPNAVRCVLRLADDWASAPP